MPAISQEEHDANNKKYQAILQSAREEATRLRNYNSQVTRTQLSNMFALRCEGKRPYPWQLDVTEALILGLDCTLIAGTGAGKTMPFVMPNFVYPDKMTAILSPLKALEEDQQARFKAMGIPTGVVQGVTWNNQLKEELLRRDYQVILASPEMALVGTADFRTLLSSPSFAKDIGSIIVDEVHCISQWGHDFRPEYSELGKLRAFVPHRVPILAASATMTPHVLEEVRKTLEIDASNSFHVNLGNDRPNISQEVRKMKAADDYAALDFLVAGATKPEDLPRAIVFVDKIEHAHMVLNRLHALVPSLKDNIDFLHARRAELSKKISMHNFKRGQTRIYIATEAAGMGMDIPDITLIVQFGTPKNLSIWIQRAGRAARSIFVQGHAIMLVQESVFKVIGGAKQADAEVEVDLEAESEEDDDEEELEETGVEGGEKTFRKKVEASLRAWIESTGCRRDVVDDYFANPPRMPATGPCCDNCVKRLGGRLTVGRPLRATGPQPAQATPSSPLRPRSRVIEPLSPSKRVNLNGKRPMERDDDDVDDSDTEEEVDQLVSDGDTAAHASGSRQKKQGAKRRGGKHLQNVKDALQRWSVKTRRTRYPYAEFSAAALLPSRTLTTIASQRRPKTTEELRGVLSPSWPLLDALGDDVLATTKRLDAADLGRRQATTLQNREARKAATRERNAKRAAEKSALREKKLRERQQKDYEEYVRTYHAACANEALASMAPSPPSHSRAALNNQHSSLTVDRAPQQQTSTPAEYPSTPVPGRARFSFHQFSLGHDAPTPPTSSYPTPSTSASDAPHAALTWAAPYAPSTPTFRPGPAEDRGSSSALAPRALTSTVRARRVQPKNKENQTTPFQSPPR